MLADDLLKTAKMLADAGKKRPKQSDLRRAVSTAYYAMFHTLTKCCADLLVGNQKSQRNSATWRHVYRSLDHRVTKDFCGKTHIIQNYPVGIQNFAQNFISLQEKRHKADYDPCEKLYKSRVHFDIKVAETSMAGFNSCTPQEKCAFAVHVLLKDRK